MMSVEHGEDQSLNSTPAREPMRRMGWDEAVNHGGNLQTSQDAKHQRHMGYGMHLLDSRGPDVPPVVPPADSIIAHDSPIP
jgi:hypothetical protein